jgi:hypothetical protein
MGTSDVWSCLADICHYRTRLNGLEMQRIQCPVWLWLVHQPCTKLDSGSPAAGVQYAIRKAGVGTANPDFPVAYFDPADQVPHIALAQGCVLVAQPGAGNGRVQPKYVQNSATVGTSADLFPSRQ